MNKKGKEEDNIDILVMGLIFVGIISASPLLIMWDLYDFKSKFYASHIGDHKFRIYAEYEAYNTSSTYNCKVINYTVSNTNEITVKCMPTVGVVLNE